MKNKYGLSFIYTTHNLEEIEEICDKIIFINKFRMFFLSYYHK